jgi:hypothetical protein
VQDPDLGLVAYGGNLVTGSDGTVTVQPKDAVRRKVYLAMYGVQFAVDAGAIESVKYGNDQVQVTIAPSIAGLSGAAMAGSPILWVERMANVGGKANVVVDKALSMERGGWKIDLKNGSFAVNITFQ